MHLPLLMTLFIVSFIAISLASLIMTQKFEKLAIRLRFSQPLLGMIMAFGANFPEIASSIFSISMKQHELGFGIIIGSNIINLAGLLGLGAIISGQIKLGFHSLILNGGMSFFTTVMIVFFVLKMISIGWVCFFLALLMFPYFYLISRRAPKIEIAKFSRSMNKFVSLMVNHSNQGIKKNEGQKFTLLDLTTTMISLFMIVAGSFALVFSSVELAGLFGVPHTIVGTLILGGLTSIPNIITAILLARKGLGSAVVSETFNSNVLNFITGICFPVLIFGMGQISMKVEFSTFWLLGMTVLAIGVLGFRKGLRRLGGVGLIALYICYATLIIFW